MRLLPGPGSAGVHRGCRRHLPPGEIPGVDLAPEHAGERPAAALADHDHDLALARLVDPQPPIPAVLATVGWLHIAAEIAAVDFRPLALAACGLPNLTSHRFAHFVRQHECRFVLRPEIAAERQHAL